MKHYMDIENLRDGDVNLIGGLVRSRNDQAFHLGDYIFISEKVDGSCASICLNPETGELDVYSRRQKLNAVNNLNGFYQYAHSLDKDIFQPNMIVFGEWTGKKNKIVYDEQSTGKWYIFDIYDLNKEQYLRQNEVQKFAVEHQLDAAKVLYAGVFQGWDHARSFCHVNSYGPVQEGVVVKNISALSDVDNRYPAYLKIVNEAFKESMKIREPKLTNPDVLEKKRVAEELASQIVTENRVAKMLMKLQDEYILPFDLEPGHMKIVASNLPKRIYDDCLKEEPEIVKSMGEYGGKAISALAMQIARKIVVG